MTHRRLSEHVRYQSHSCQIGPDPAALESFLQEFRHRKHLKKNERNTNKSY